MSLDDRLLLIDEEDKEKVSKYKWYSYRRYIYTKVDKKTLYLHRYLMEASAGLEVDHIDGNRFNNRKSNLRVCSVSENRKNVGKRGHNTSGFKGVHFFKRRGNYTAQIASNKKIYFLGYFQCPIEAAKAYDIAAIKYHGNFARLNFERSL